MDQPEHRRIFDDLHGVSDVQVDLHFLNSVQELQENTCEDRVCIRAKGPIKPGLILVSVA